MPYQITDCQTLEAAQLCAAMNDAFSDYTVPLSLTLEKFVTFQKQRGFSAEHSFVAMDGPEIAGFWYSGAPDTSIAGRAYAVSVGTAPSHRRKGLSRTLMREVIQKQKADGATGLQLEVITTNDKAVEAYRNFGFAETRILRVCKLPADCPGLVSQDGPQLARLTVDELPEDESRFFDARPTPQNGRAALVALADQTHLYGLRGSDGLLGWGAANPDGSVAQIAVRSDQRRKGIGTAILRKLGTSVGAEQLTFVNVDSNASSINAFLDKAGAQDTIQQWEMHLTF